MQNHLHICNNCRLQEEQSGKRIAWVGGLQLDQPITTVEKTPHETAPTTLAASIEATQATSGIFAMLEVSPEAPTEGVVDGIKKKMRYWMTQPKTEEKERMIDQLREWQEEINNDSQFLQKQRARLQEKQRGGPQQVNTQGSALHVGATAVYSGQELVAACERSRQEWSAAETHLRSGELEYWVYSQTGNPSLAQEVHIVAQSSQPNFRALNSILYRLSPERPFRLYRHDAWQAPKGEYTARTPAELARLCDQHWDQAKHHLYNGAMVPWLEHSRGVRGLQEWYQTMIAGYGQSNRYWGLGLELILERAVPTLTRPELVVTFDGNKDQYRVEDWDSEIPHRPIEVSINNATRGVTANLLELVNPAPPAGPDWIYLEDSRQAQQSYIPGPLVGTMPAPQLNRAYTTRPVEAYNRPGERNPVRKRLFLQNLAQLDYGKTYTATLRMSELREYQQPAVVRDYPIRISTMQYRQGFRERLWQWGLRGQLPGLGWNFLAGAVLALIILLLVSTLLPTIYTNRIYQYSLSAVKYTLVDFLGWKFVLLSGIITGLIGLRIGSGKGHANYPAKNNARDFRIWGFWCALIFVAVLLFWDQGFREISQAFQTQGTTSLNILLWYGAGGLLVGVCIFLIVLIISFLRSLTERMLRRHYKDVLEPEGRK